MHKQYQDDELIQAVLDGVCRQRLSKLSARTIAKSANVSAALIGYRHGGVEQLVQKAKQSGALKRMHYWQAAEEQILDVPPTRADLVSVAHASVRSAVWSEPGAVGLFWDDLYGSRGSQEGDLNAKAILQERAFWSEFALRGKLSKGIVDVLLCLSLSMQLGYVVVRGRYGFEPWALSLWNRFFARLTGNEPFESGDCSFRIHAELQLKQFEYLDTSDHSTAQKILDGIVEIIMSDGAEALTHRAIAGQTGVSVSSVQHFFGTRRDCLNAAFWLLISRSRERAVPAMPEPEAHTTATLLASLDRGIAQDREASLRESMVMNDLILSAAMSPESEVVAAGLFARTGETSLTLLNSLRNLRGELSRIDAQIFSLCLGQASTLSAVLKDAPSFFKIGTDLIEALFVSP